MSQKVFGKNWSTIKPCLSMAKAFKQKRTTNKGYLEGSNIANKIAGATLYRRYNNKYTSIYI